MKIRKRILWSVIIVAIIVFASNFVKAEGLETLEGRRVELQEKITEQNTQMAEIEEKITENLVELSKLDGEIGDYEIEVAEINLKLVILYKEVEEVEKKLIHIEKDYAKQKNAFEQRLVAAYEAGETQYLDVLLHSSSLSDFVSNYFLISEIAQYDSDLLDTIEREKITIQNIKKVLDEKKLTLNNLKTNKERTIIAIENTKVIKNIYIKKLTEDEANIQAQIDAYRNELNSVDNEILALALLNADGTYVGGEFAWPAPGYSTITSRYGMRIHPIFKYSRMHSGTDIAMPTGANIVAANDGLVIKSTYNDAYGNMIMIDHGGGVTTVYGHGSELVAKVGDQVKRGDIILKAGSTGWSTGPHLHFEVRINGVCVDSLPYITRKITIPEKNNEENATNNESNL